MSSDSGNEEFGGWNLLPVCDGEDGLVPKPLSDGLLQQSVRLLVHAGCGLIDAQELRVEKQGRSRPDATQIRFLDSVNGTNHVGSDILDSDVVLSRATESI